MARRYDIFDSNNALATVLRLRKILLEERILSEEEFPSVFADFLKREYGSDIKVASSDDMSSLVIIYKQGERLGKVETPAKYTVDEKLKQVLISINKKIDMVADHYIKSLSV